MMNFYFLLEHFNYGLVLIFGIFLSAYIAGGFETSKQKNLLILICPFLLMIQAIFSFLWGVETVEALYPLIVHLPLLLILVFLLKKRFSVALISILTAYLCCEIPRWIMLLSTTLSNSILVGEICYTFSIIPAFILLIRHFAPSAHDAITISRKSQILFGSLPLTYYLFDYITTVYSNALYSGIYALNEFIPTILVVFYVLLLTAYHGQQEKRAEAELRHSILEAELKQSETEMDNLRHTERQTAIYQHDMRHHLRMIESFLSTGKVQQAEDYIKNVYSDIEAITPKRYCENETVNLLVSAFVQRAEKSDIQLLARVKLPREQPIPDTELCAVISNGLDNALRAAAATDKQVDFYCDIRHNKLLIEIKNAYSGEIIIKNGLPYTEKPGHGHGTKSIRAITESHHGICTFEAQNGIFTLRIALPI